MSTPPVWLVCPVPTTARASPKSATFTTPSMPMSTFSGLMSRCTMPARCAAVSPASTGSRTAKASADGQPAAGGEQVAQRAAAHQLHDQEHQALVAALVADPDDVGVAEHRRGAGLAGEPVDERRVVGQVLGHHLHRDRLVQPEVGGRVDRGHAAAREPLLEAVAPLEDEADHGVGHGGVHPNECRSGPAHGSANHAVQGAAVAPGANGPVHTGHPRAVAAGSAEVQARVQRVAGEQLGGGRPGPLGQARRRSCTSPGRRSPADVVVGRRAAEDVGDELGDPVELGRAEAARGQRRGADAGRRRCTRRRSGRPGWRCGW